MLLKQLDIKNFRGIAELSLSLDDLCVLIGENNAGKSSILDALRLCLTRSLTRRARVFEEYDYHLENTSAEPAKSKPIEITLKFAEVEEDEWPDEVSQLLSDAEQVDVYTLEGIDLNVRDIMSHASTEDGNYLRSWAVAALNRRELSESARELINTSLVPVLLGRLDFWHFEDDAFAWLDGLPDTAPDFEGVFDEYQEEKETWHQLANEISAQFGKQEVTLHLLLQELDLRSKSPVPPKDAIPCFTIHASTGMEFDHVYLVGMVEDQLPSWAAIRKGDSSREMQEERRNCFVAITRAQETLTLTYSDRVQGWQKETSRFLFEMGLLEEA